MTVLVGLRFAGGVAIATDSVSSTSSGRLVTSGSKVRQLPVGDEWAALATCGNPEVRARARLLDLDDLDTADLDTWAADVADALTVLVDRADDECARIDPDDDESSPGVYGLLAFRDRLWSVHRNLAVPAVAEVAGSGEDFALGALHVMLADLDTQPGGLLAGDVAVRVVTRAAEAAIVHQSDCGPPIHVAVTHAEDASAGS